jgi:hypothetical protein
VRELTGAGWTRGPVTFRIGRDRREYAAGLILRSHAGSVLADPTRFSAGPSKEKVPVKKEEVLAKLKAGEMTVEEASKLLEEEPPKRGTLYCKVSQKGAVSVYGLQRMPVTLYVEQWERLLGFGETIQSFLKEHDSELKRKEK